MSFWRPIFGVAPLQGYRYWSGVNVQANCETALTWYRKVAQQVAEEVRLAGGTAIQRIRLPDETDNPNSASANALMDENLLQYYRFLADKGDIQAQVSRIRDRLQSKL